jgi:hypothetical protein
VGSPEHFVHLLVKGLGTKQLWGLLLYQALVFFAPWFLQRKLLERMIPERRACGWNALTQATAIIWLNVFSMIPFAWVTRTGRGYRAGVLALLIGATWSALLLGLSAGAGEVIVRAFEIPLND